MKFLIKRKRKMFTYAAAAALLLLAAAFIAAPMLDTAYTSGSERKLPIYCVETDEKKIAMSFDAAWGADDTEELLRILEENDVKTTFFMCGTWVSKYPDEVKKIYESGHELGNHSASHPHMASLTREEIAKELLGCHESVKILTGVDMELFRPPFGEYDNEVIETADELDYYTIQWDVDSLDWKEYGVERQVKQVLDHKHLGNGSIILFHNDAKYTPQALDTIIKGLKADGYTIVPVSELIIKKNYYMDHEGRQKPLPESKNKNSA